MQGRDPLGEMREAIAAWKRPPIDPVGSQQRQVHQHQVGLLCLDHRERIQRWNRHRYVRLPRVLRVRHHQRLHPRRHQGGKREDIPVHRNLVKPALPLGLQQRFKPCDHRYAQLQDCGHHHTQEYPGQDAILRLCSAPTRRQTRPRSSSGLCCVGPPPAEGNPTLP